MKRTPLRRTTPLKRGGRLTRRTPLRAMSRKRREVQVLRRQMVRDELARRELCEAGPVIYRYRRDAYGRENADRLHAVAYRCGGLAVDLHEPLTRARGGSILDPANTVAVCRSCHEWIHDNPAAATKVGLLRSA